MGIHFGSAPNPTVKVSPITQQLQRRDSGGKESLSTFRDSAEHLLPSLFFISTSKEHHIDERHEDLLALTMYFIMF